VKQRRAAGRKDRERYKVGELELSHGIQDVAGCDGYVGLRLLLRYRGRPVGWLHLATNERPRVSARTIRAAIRRRWGWSLVPLALDPALGHAPFAGSTPPISVVVCTRDRTDLLGECLQALLAQDYPAYEIIVVDNAPASDATARLTATLPVRYVRENRPGLDWARNRGIAEARYEIVAYTDDDARADRGWLRGLATAFADPSVAAVTGLVAPAELDTEAQILFEDVYGGMRKGLAPRRFDAKTMRPRELIASYQLGVGANMAYRRQLFRRLGAFDTALDVGTPSRGAGDLDMFHRVLAAGLILHYEPTALVWHRHRRKRTELWRQLNNDGRSFGVYLMKVFRERSVRRVSLLRFAVWDWARWMVGRCLLGLARRHRLPLSLLWAGLLGMAQAPWAYIMTYRADRRLRSESEEYCAGQSAVRIGEFVESSHVSTRSNGCNVAPGLD
jgi:glycosyltransferase involved in cell wall biosynthesis